MEQERTVEPIVGVNGNMITVEYSHQVMQNEVAYATVGNARIKCEVIRVRGKYADLQVFESTNGLKVGDEVEFTGDMLSAALEKHKKVFPDFFVSIHASASCLYHSKSSFAYSSRTKDSCIHLPSRK